MLIKNGGEKIVSWRVSPPHLLPRRPYLRTLMNQTTSLMALTAGLLLAGTSEGAAQTPLGGKVFVNINGRTAEACPMTLRRLPQFGVGERSSSSLWVTVAGRGFTLILPANSSGLVKPFNLYAGDLMVSPFARLFL